MLFSEIIGFCCQNQKKLNDTECAECRYLRHLTDCSYRMIIQYNSLNLSLSYNM